MSDEEICEMMGWPKRAAALMADFGLLGRICAVVREAERREREACAKVCEQREFARLAAAVIRARNNK